MKSKIEIDNKIYSYNLNKIFGNLKILNTNIYGSTNIGNAPFSYSLYFAIEKTHGTNGPYIAPIISKKKLLFYVYNNINGEFDHKADRIFKNIENATKYCKLIYKKNVPIKNQKKIIHSYKLLIPINSKSLLKINLYPYYMFRIFMYFLFVFGVIFTITTNDFKQNNFSTTKYYNIVKKDIEKRFIKNQWESDQLITISYDKCISTFNKWEKINISTNWNMYNYECNQYNSIANWKNNNKNKISFKKIAKHYGINQLENSYKSIKIHNIKKRTKTNATPLNQNILAKKISTLLKNQLKHKKIIKYEIKQNTPMINKNNTKNSESNHLFEKYNKKYLYIRILSSKNMFDTIRKINNISNLGIIRNLQIVKNKSLYNINVEIFIHTLGTN